MIAKWPMIGILSALGACGFAQPDGRPVAPAPYVATAVGRIDSADEARRLVASIDGVIQRVHVARGDFVAAGQLLLSVDCAPRLAEVAARTADVARAKAAAQVVLEGARPEAIATVNAGLVAAQSDALNQQQRYDQAARLIAPGFVSKRELDARTNARDRAVAEVVAAQAQLDQLRNGARRAERSEALARAQVARGEAQMAQSSADKCQMHSPIAGQILQIMRREGEFSAASQGQTLLVVGDMRHLSVRAEINERDATMVRVGQRVDVWVEGGHSRWYGHVTQVANMMGRRNARALDPTDRFDRDVREVFVGFDGALPPALVGLRVTVGLKA